jgi:8-oxo-dGTP diphosphatase
MAIGLPARSYSSSRQNDAKMGEHDRRKYDSIVRVPEVCVVYLLRTINGERQVLLGTKRTGLGMGNIVGPGGKLEVGESSRQAAAREVREEVDVQIALDALRPIGELLYLFPYKPSWTQRSWAFLAEEWIGEPTESLELAPIWYPVKRLPLAKMWDDAKFWLPAALDGQYVSATFEFAEDCRTVSATSRRDVRL